MYSDRMYYRREGDRVKREGEGRYPRGEEEEMEGGDFPPFYMPHQHQLQQQHQSHQLQHQTHQQHHHGRRPSLAADMGNSWQQNLRSYPSGAGGGQRPQHTPGYGYQQVSRGYGGGSSSRGRGGSRHHSNSSQPVRSSGYGQQGGGGGSWNNAPSSGNYHNYRNPSSSGGQQQQKPVNRHSYIPKPQYNPRPEASDSRATSNKTKPPVTSQSNKPITKPPPVVTIPVTNVDESKLTPDVKTEETVSNKTLESDKTEVLNRTFTLDEKENETPDDLAVNQSAILESVQAVQTIEVVTAEEVSSGGETVADDLGSVVLSPIEEVDEASPRIIGSPISCRVEPTVRNSSEGGSSLSDGEASKEECVVEVIGEAVNTSDFELVLPATPQSIRTCSDDPASPQQSATFSDVVPQQSATCSDAPAASTDVPAACSDVPAASSDAPASTQQSATCSMVPAASSDAPASPHQSATCSMVPAASSDAPASPQQSATCSDVPQQSETCSDVPKVPEQSATPSDVPATPSQPSTCSDAPAPSLEATPSVKDEELYMSADESISEDVKQENAKGLPEIVAADEENSTLLEEGTSTLKENKQTVGTKTPKKVTILEPELTEKLGNLEISAGGQQRRSRKSNILVDSSNLVETSTIQYVEVKCADGDTALTPVRRSTRLKASTVATPLRKSPRKTKSAATTPGRTVQNPFLNID